MWSLHSNLRSFKIARLYVFTRPRRKILGRNGALHSSDIFGYCCGTDPEGSGPELLFDAATCQQTSTTRHSRAHSVVVPTSVYRHPLNI